MIPDSKALGQWVKSQREDAGLTQEELANRIRCKKAYISKVENASLHSVGKRAPSPTLKFLHNLSKALGTSIATPLAKLGYLRAAGADMEISSHPIRILHYYNELSEEDQALAEEMVKALWTRRRVPHELEQPKPKPRSKPPTKIKTA